MPLPPGPVTSRGPNISVHRTYCHWRMAILPKFRRWWWFLLPLVASAADGFDPPTANAARAAIGSLDGLDWTSRRLLTPDEGFPLMDAPEPGDWLSLFDETGQTFDAFVAAGAGTYSSPRRVIYLQPLGGFPEEASPDLEALESYASAFFQMDVRMLAPVDIDGRALRVRLHPDTRQPQILTTAILAQLKEHLPDDAHCLVAVTMADLYPADGWSYVFGQASLQDRVGVFSFARSDPGFFGEPRGDEVGDMILQRSAKTLVHEIAHTFGLRHCIFYQCVENGSNHQQESDRRPQHLCPVCLRKLRHATGLNLEKRYRDLEFFYEEHGWIDEATWVSRQLARLKPAAPEVAPPVPRPYVPPPLPPLPVKPITLPPWHEPEDRAEGASGQNATGRDVSTPA